MPSRSLLALLLCLPTALAAQSLQVPCKDVPGPSLTAGVLTLPPCLEVQWTAAADGRGPLTYEWQTDTGQQWTGNPLVFDTRDLPSGFRRLELVVRNPWGSTRRDSFLVVESLSPSAPQLEPAGGLSVTASSPASTGGLDWRYCWGDGSCTPWILDHCRPPERSHTYATAGTYAVTLEGRNCRDGSRLSVPTPVTVPSISIDTFEVQGCSAFCDFAAGQSLLFHQAFSGQPTSYRYDWRGDGLDVDTSTSPILNHAYTGPGAFRPILTVRKGALEVERQHLQWIVISGDVRIFNDGFETGNTAAWSATVP